MEEDKLSLREWLMAAVGLIMIIGLVVRFFGGSETGTDAAEDLSLAKNVVRGQCMALDPGVTSGSFGMMPMSINVTAFGEKKVDEWCSCAYDKISKAFTDEQITSSADAGMYDPITDKMSAAVTLATAACIKESDLPVEGRRHANSYADMLVQSYQLRSQMSDALRGATGN